MCSSCLSPKGVAYLKDLLKKLVVRGSGNVETLAPPIEIIDTPIYQILALDVTVVSDTEKKC